MHEIHKKYTIQFKIKVIELIHMNIALHLISNKLGIDRHLLREWLAKESEHRAVKQKDKKFRCAKLKSNHTQIH